MLRERRELLEREIRKLTWECGQQYLSTVTSLDEDEGAITKKLNYKCSLSKLMEMKTELEIVINLIEEGFD